MDFVLFLNVINYYITSWDVPKKLRKAKPCAGVYARRAAPLSGVVARAARIPSSKVETYLETLARGLIILIKMNQLTFWIPVFGS